MHPLPSYIHSQSGARALSARPLGRLPFHSLHFGVQKNAEAKGKEAAAAAAKKEADANDLMTKITKNRQRAADDSDEESDDSDG